MDSPLKQRLIGAAVLVALAVIFLPMLLKGPDVKEPDAAQVPLSMPATPGEEYETHELPLAAPDVFNIGGGQRTNLEQLFAAIRDAVAQHVPAAAAARPRYGDPRTGDVLGTPTHILMSLSSLLLVVMAVTGVVIWWKKLAY